MTVAHNSPPLEAADLDSAVEAVREGGLRATTARRLLLEALWGTSEPLTAEQLSDRIGASADVASVYRNLEAFERLGLIRHFHLGHGPGLYARTGLGRASTWSATPAAPTAPSTPPASTRFVS